MAQPDFHASHVTVDIFDVPQVAACGSTTCDGPSFNIRAIEALREVVEQDCGDAVVVNHYDVTDEATRAKHAETIMSIREEALRYPVTYVNGQVVFDGAISYPTIMRALKAQLGEAGQS